MLMSLEHLILGLLDLAPMTGYDLKKAFDSSVAHFWFVDQAQVYRALAKLVDEGSASVRVIEHEGRPARREHCITEQGRQELSEWLASPLDDERTKDPFIARIFFAGREEPDVARRILAQRRADAENRLARLRALPEATDSRAGRLRTATLRYGLKHLEAELAWIDDTEELL